MRNDCVLLENFGTICKIKCPDCDNIRKMSSFVNKTTRKCTFSVSNFARHHAAHDEEDHDTNVVQENVQIETDQQNNYKLRLSGKIF